MLYNMKIGKTLKKGQEREERITPYYIYTRARREGKEKTGTKEGRMDFKKKEGGGTFFPDGGECFYRQGNNSAKGGEKSLVGRGDFLNDASVKQRMR